MQYRQGNTGRVFLIRFEDGEDVREKLIELAAREQIQQAFCFIIGALRSAKMVIGPKEAVFPPEPMWASFADGREMFATGLIVQSANGPVVHLHMAAQRLGENAKIGCLRADGKVYLMAECLILEAIGFTSVKAPLGDSGLEALTFKS